MALTPEQIRLMSAGPAMNAAVAIAFGWRWVDNMGGRGPFFLPPEKLERIKPEFLKKNTVEYNGEIPDSVPHWSTDIAVTFKMQAEIERRGLWKEYVRQLVLLITTAEHAAKTIWYADDADWWAVANASPLDRCRAALLVLAGRQEGR